MHEISRRAAITGGLKLAGAGALGAEIGWATGVGEKRYQINDVARAQIDEIAKTMEGSIHAQKGDAFSPNPIAISRTLAQMAYVEGGIEEARQVASFIVQRGLEIKIEGLGRLYAGASATTQWSFTYDEPVKVTFSDRYFTEYMNKGKNKYMFLHEFYHVIQQARNPEAVGEYVLAEVGLLLAVPTVAGVWVYRGLSREDKEKGITRRKFLHRGKNAAIGLGFGILSIIPARMSLGVLAPVEHEAYAKTSEHSPFKIVSDRSFDELADNFFIKS